MFFVRSEYKLQHVKQRVLTAHRHTRAHKKKKTEDEEERRKNCLSGFYYLVYCCQITYDQLCSFLSVLFLWPATDGERVARTMSIYERSRESCVERQKNAKRREPDIVACKWQKGQLSSIRLRSAVLPFTLPLGSLISSVATVFSVFNQKFNLFNRNGNHVCALWAQNHLFSVVLNGVRVILLMEYRNTFFLSIILHL